MEFLLIDADLCVVYDADEKRASRRHKWQAVKSWNRWGFGSNSLSPRPIPEDVVEQALAAVRAQIQFKGEVEAVEKVT